jgi:hypothetical protein
LKNRWRISVPCYPAFAGKDGKIGSTGKDGKPNNDTPAVKAFKLAGKRRR